MENKCCICGKEFEGFGNNPYPIAKGIDQVCCDECNFTKVIPARLEQMSKEKERKS